MDENLIGNCNEPIMSVEEIVSQAKVHPNPNKGHFTIDCNECIGKEVVLKNSLGQSVWRGLMNSDRMDVRLGGKKGVFALVVDGVAVGRVVVE